MGMRNCLLYSGCVFFCILY